jgi:hypothetical protein
MGKVSLLMVMMFNIVFMYMGFNLSGIASHAYKNYTNYYTSEQAQFLVESASNIALGSINQNLRWCSTDSTVHTYTITDKAAPTNVLGTYSIKAATTWPSGVRTVTFTITAVCGSLTENSVVAIRTPQFSEYAMYTVYESSNIFWVSGEVCDGPLHTEGNLQCSGSPTFKGYVTAKGTITKSSATFEQGYKQGVSIPFVTDYSAVKAVAGYDSMDTPKSSYTYKDKGVTKTATWQADLFVQFNADGTIEVDTGQYVGNGMGYYTAKTGGTKYKKYTSITQLASSGVFGILDTNSVANVHIRGTVKGQMSVVNLGKGSIYIDSSVVYKDTLTDILGIVARDTVYVTDDTINNKGKVNIQATILAESFTAQNYGSRDANTSTGTADNGMLYLRGGIQQNNRGAVGSGTNGFSKQYKYDTRFQGTGGAPGYPQLSQFALISWYDNIQWPTNWWNLW